MLHHQNLHSPFSTQYCLHHSPSIIAMARLKIFSQQTATTMPPPTDTVTFPAPPGCIYTVQQPVGHIPPVASPPPSRSCGNRVRKSSGHVPHISNKLNDTYEPILAVSFHLAYPVVLSTFHHSISSILEAATTRLCSRGMHAPCYLSLWSYCI